MTETEPSPSEQGPPPSEAEPSPGQQGGFAVDSVPAAARPTPSTRAWWKDYLTPAAIVIGSAIIGGAVWLGRGDNESAPATAAAGDLLPVSAAPTSASPGNAGSSPAAGNLLSAYRGYARQIGLDEARFVQCLGDKGQAQVINDHLQRGIALGITGTPTFYINNKKIVGSQPTAVFQEVIAAELKASPSTLDGYSAAIKQLAATTPPRFEILASRPDLSGAHFEGNRTARVVVAEFSDFQCPFCKRWTDDTLKTLRGLVGTDVALAFLHFPILQIHPNAGAASMAAVCAGDQDKFWPMHDLLFARQAEWANLPGGAQ